MPTLSDFKTQGITAFAAIAKGEISPSAILRRILQTWPDIFDGSVFSLDGLPFQLPAELPTIAASSGDGSSAIEVSRLLVTARWVRRGDVEPRLDDVFALLAQRLASIYEGHFEVGRLGIAMNRTAMSKEHPREIAQRFTRADYVPTLLERPETFELHAHNVISLTNGLHVNSWTRIKALRPTGQDSQVVVEQDINTLTEEASSRTFRGNDMAVSFKLALHEFDKMIELCFPRSK